MYVGTIKKKATLCSLSLNSAKRKNIKLQCEKLTGTHADSC